MTTTTTTEDNGHAASALAKVTANIDGLDLRTIGTVLVRSGYFQDTREVAQAIVKVLAGRELGFGPIASMQGVYIVKGRVTLAANLVAAAIQRSGRFRYRVAKLDKTGCVIKFYERWDGGDWQEIGESTFDPSDAETAGLTKGDNYRAFPRNMYFARALTNGARWYTPEVFNGPVYTPDEMGARVDDDGQVVAIPSAPPMDTAEVRRQADRYHQIFGSDREGTAYADQPSQMAQHAGRTVDTATGEVLADRAAEPRRPSRSDLWQRNRALCKEADALGVTGAPTLNTRALDDELAEANRVLEERIYNAKLDRKLAAEQQAVF